MSSPTPDATEQDFLDEEASHWGTWRARGPIFIDGVRAFNAGHDVPNGHVERFHLEEQGLVERIGQEAEQAAEGDSATTTEPPAAPQGEPIQGDATVVGDAAGDDSPIFDQVAGNQQ